MTTLTDATCEMKHQDTPEWAYLNGNPLDGYSIQHIAQCGCASGAHMDAVTYGHALRVMLQHEDEIVEYIYNHSEFDLNEIEWHSLSRLCSHILQVAIELWCCRKFFELIEQQEEEEESKTD